MYHPAEAVSVFDRPATAPGPSRSYSCLPMAFCGVLADGRPLKRSGYNLPDLLHMVRDVLDQTEYNG